MAKERFSEDAVLLKLYRRYGKDESLNYLFDEISKLNFTIGGLKSELEETKDAYEKLRRTKTTYREVITKEMSKEIAIEERVQEFKKNADTQAKMRQKAEKDVEMWRNKYLALIAKTGKEMIVAT